MISKKSKIIFFALFLLILVGIAKIVIFQTQDWLNSPLFFLLLLLICLFLGWFSYLRHKKNDDGFI
jgi:hypothetical protein